MQGAQSNPTQPTHPIFGTPTLPSGVEDEEGWAFRRARSCEVTLSPEEVADAADDGIDVRCLDPDNFHFPMHPGFARFNGRWFMPVSRTTVASGLDPATHPGEFIALDNAECAALDRVVAHWRSQSEVE